MSSDTTAVNSSVPVLLEAYALLVAHLERYPDARQAIFESYGGLEREGRRLLEAAVANGDVAVLGPFGDTVQKTKALLASPREEPVPTSSLLTAFGPAPPEAGVTESFAAQSTSPALPPAPTSGLPQPRLSIEQYAQLRADCVADPDRAPTLRRRYGLDEAGDEAETQAWGRRFTMDGALFIAYKSLFRRHRDMQEEGSAHGPATPSPAAPAGAGVAAPESPDVVYAVARHRILSLGEHAAMSAELMFLPHDVVYAKYDLADADVRSRVLRVCELRLQDPAARAAWTRLHELQLERLRGSRG